MIFGGQNDLKKNFFINVSKVSGTRKNDVWGVVSLFRAPKHLQKSPCSYFRRFSTSVRGNRLFQAEKVLLNPCNSKYPMPFCLCVSYDHETKP